MLCVLVSIYEIFNASFTSCVCVCLSDLDIYDIYELSAHLFICSGWLIWDVFWNRVHIFIFSELARSLGGSLGVFQRIILSCSLS